MKLFATILLFIGTLSLSAFADSDSQMILQDPSVAAVLKLMND